MRGRRLVLGLLGAAVVIDVAYWLTWLADRSLLASSHRQAYYEFENSFPLADLWLAIACLGALVALLRCQPAALFWCIAAGASGIYLFGMDLLYDVEHSILFHGGGGWIEALLVLVELVFSLTVLRFAWRERFRLLVGRP